MKSWHRAPVAAAIFATLLVSSAAAVDRPIAAKRLTIRDRPPFSAPLVSFAARDPAMLVPVFNSADDPARSTDMRIDIWTQSHPMASQTIRSGEGSDWRTVSRRRNLYLYKNPRLGAPVKVVLLTDSGRLRIRMSSNLAIDGPRGPVAIRVQTGDLRNCTLFDASTILRDHGGVFVAANSSATTLADCDDATIAAALGDSCGLSARPECGGACPDGGICGTTAFDQGCRCFAPSQPCGPNNAPVCNGACQLGEECIQIDGIYQPECQCTEVGVLPCGAAGGTACPDGSTCQTLHWTVVGEPVTYHRCIDDDAVCGQPGFGKCDVGFECQVVGTPLDASYTCLPIFCGGFYPGGFPTCDQSCPAGLQCGPGSVSGIDFCFCS